MNEYMRSILTAITGFVLLLHAAAPAVTAPRRIVCLAPYVTEAIFLLGAEDSLVGVTTYCLRPPAAQEKIIVGTVVHINVEQVIALTPDLIIATPLTDPRGITRLQTMNLPVTVLPVIANFEQLCVDMQTLGEIIGRAQQARAIVATATDRLTAVRLRYAAVPAKTVFLQIGANPLFTLGRGYLVHDLIESSGGSNIAAAAVSGLFSREMVLAADPDFIIITTMGMAGDEQVRLWQQYPSLQAVQHNRVLTIDDQIVCSPTPLSFVEACEQLSLLLHGGEHGHAQ